MPGCAARLREELVAPAHEWEEPCAARIQESLLHSRLVGDGAGGGIAHSHDSLSIFLSLASGLKALPFSMQMVASMPRISALEASFRLGLDDFIDVS